MGNPLMGPERVTSTVLSTSTVAIPANHDWSSIVVHRTFLAAWTNLSAPGRKIKDQCPEATVIPASVSGATPSPKAWTATAPSMSHQLCRLQIPREWNSKREPEN
ncbi:hypothetical protein L3Y34_000058 [Caenorhabditis briggsae]|uniref:Uncharacterized protein n=1 Tax=Caenorhabditis briggsae TaxID=6238 RepID=A0AAE9D8A6_CAEBR|nr:hypothetical protein L3Y34_000058 [Caenorhabditis briggsae]